MSPIALETRNADLDTVRRILEDQRARRLDLVINSHAIRSQDGVLHVADSVLGMDLDRGVGRQEAAFEPTEICDEKLAGRLAIPTAFLKSLRQEGRTDLYDALVNGRLHGGGEYVDPDLGPQLRWPADSRKHLVRLLQGDPGERGVARAFMSNKYRFMESLDVLLAILAGVRQAGMSPIPPVCDLSDRRFHMRMEFPGLAMLAPKLLAAYRNPFGGAGARERAGLGDMTLKVDRGGWNVADAFAAAEAEGMGYAPGDEPVVWAGIVASNSDVGDGARTLAPQIRVKVCRNGLTIKAFVDRKIHLGSAHDEGTVEWSAATQEAELSLITGQVRDSVNTWCKPEWLAERVAEIEALADAPVTDARVTVVEVAKGAGFTAAQAEDIFGWFREGGQETAAGIANAATAWAQAQTDPALQVKAEDKAMAMMEAVARKAK